MKIGELSGKAKTPKGVRPIRTEGREQNSCQGQSVGGETVLQNITHPRVSDSQNG